MNADLAEGFPYDEELLKIVTSANICCGVHAGSESLTISTVVSAMRHRVRIVCHPGFPDRPNMGRSHPTPEQIRPWIGSIYDQVLWFCREFQCDAIKPHGAFYNLLALDRDHPDYLGDEATSAWVALLRECKVSLVGLSATAHESQAKQAGVALYREGFADRGYDDSGSLLPREFVGALLTDNVAIRNQMQRLMPVVQTFCVHGDSPNCLEIAKIARHILSPSLP